MTNAAAIGYMILAAKRLQKLGEPLPDELILELDRMMNAMMDVKSEEEAKEAYQNN